MGCGSSTQGTELNRPHQPVLGAETPEDVDAAREKLTEHHVECPLIEAQSVELTSEGMRVHISREEGRVVCRVDEEMRSSNVLKMYFDPYWCYLRFPDTGRGGRMRRDKALPTLLGKLKGVVRGTACRAWIPEYISLEQDVPGNLQRQQHVKAVDDIHVGEGTLAVARGTNGTVVGVILPSGPVLPNVVGSGMPRINVKWERREDGKTKKISVLPEECRLTSDLPGHFLRGSKVLRLEDKEMITPYAGVVVGPSKASFHGDLHHVRVYWDETGEDQDVHVSDLHMVVFNHKK